MDFELIEVKDNKIEIAKETIKQMKKLEKAKMQLEMLDDRLREELKNAMEMIGANKFVSSEGDFIVTYIPEKTTMKFSSKKFKEEKPEMYEMYKEQSITKAYVRLTVK